MRIDGAIAAFEHEAMTIFVEPHELRTIRGAGKRSKFVSADEL